MLTNVSVTRPVRKATLLFALLGLTVFLVPPTVTTAADEPAFTGIVIDARHLPEIDRSPAPVIYGPAPASKEVYPDPHCVPTPDEVQEQSVVRYYHTEESAENAIAGKHPLIIKADAVVGPAHDSVRISDEAVTRMKTLDSTLHFTRTWKVAFLIPENR